MARNISLISNKTALHKALQQNLAGENVVFSLTAESGFQSFLSRPFSFDVIVIELNSEKDLDIVTRILAINNSIPIVVIVPRNHISLAQRGIQIGAIDFVENDEDISARFQIVFSKINSLVNISEEKEKLHSKNINLLEENKYYKTRFKEGNAFIGASRRTEELIAKIKKVAPLPRPVLITGERGTGKELVARLLHSSSHTQRFSFVTINCAAMNENLLESELFGHERGAFTDAKETKRGKFELADGGTLFLDEIGNMPLSFQKKVLRVIEYQEFERISGTKSIQVDVRVIAATNADLKEAAKNGQFREDLYDRLTFEVIHVFPLRQRHEDISDLSHYFLDRFYFEVPGIIPRKISPEVIQAFKKYTWPGNVRELKFTVERMAYQCQQDEIGLQDVPEEILRDTKEISNFKEEALEHEKKALVNAARSVNWNKKKLSKLLGLSYDQVRYLFRKHGLQGVETDGKW